MLSDHSGIKLERNNQKNSWENPTKYLEIKQHTSK